jgi:hypothetical protein
VSNAISFPFPFSQVFGQGIGMWINVQAAIGPADYAVAVYDSQTNYLGYFGGSTPDGNISFTWDLTTGSGSPPLTDPTFRLDYYVTPPGGSFTTPDGSFTTPAASQWKIGEASWNPTGFVIAGATIDDSARDTLAVQTMVLDGVVNVLGGPYTLAPNGNTPEGNAWILDQTGTKNQLLDALDVNHNFYFFGHGGPLSFGAYHGSTISYADLYELGNYPASNRPTNSHPYKLVFIDGCQAGKGNLCESFGIPIQSVDINYFLAAGVRTRAFIGFTKAIDFNYEQYDFRARMLGQFWTDWLSNMPLYYCVTNAQKHWPTQPIPASQ